jgi:hypothetical protein
VSDLLQLPERNGENGSSCLFQDIDLLLKDVATNTSASAYGDDAVYSPDFDDTRPERHIFKTNIDFEEVLPEGKISLYLDAPVRK